MSRFASLLITALITPALAAQAAPASSNAPKPAAAARTGQPGMRTSATAQAFDYAQLKGEARTLAGRPYQAPKNTLAPVLANLTYDQYNNIRARAEHSLWADEALDFHVQFFHTGRGFNENIHMYEVRDGQAREILYDPAMFDYDRSGLDPSTLRDKGGFAGFRLQSSVNWKADVTAFLGASYFRAVGDTRQYGLSARGVAVDTALDRPEEFPRFVSFWFERPAKGASSVTVYALMDSASLTGAYRFVISPGGTQVMDVDAALYPRKPIERLGLAPLTSMFLNGENDRRIANDWRPEIHDSDGLSIWTGSGEWIWRPLANPAGLRVNSFQDENPRGFGVLLRDRNWDHYQDDNVYYDRRPSLWVEPRSGPAGTGQGGWGKGWVQLVEIPTIDETFDNIVAYWNPKEPVKAGSELLYGYRLYWGTQMPATPPLAQTVATRTGIGGTVGQKRTGFSWHFTVDFAGGDLPALLKDSEVEAVISTSRGTLEHVTAHQVPEFGGWRALFEVRLTDESLDPVDLRCFLRIRGRPLTETWIYQWNPPPLKERKAAM
ncbi:MAG: glucan biosynthesis protein D [Steroidobacteraceae bacterium]